jgi:DNA-binding NtrC family response regulator
MQVLLVHDDDSLLGALRMVLTGSSDDDVIAVATDAALGVASRRGVDVLVIDAGKTPEASAALIRAMRHRWPGAMVLVLLAVGTTPAAREALAKAAGTCRFLRRPFSTRAFATAVRELGEMAARCEQRSRAPLHRESLLDEPAA